MKQSEIEEQNQFLLKLQRQFRSAADVVTDAWMGLPFVSAIALIGSVARPLWKEVPRFREYRSSGIKVWHECHALILLSGWTLLMVLTPFDVREQVY